MESKLKDTIGKTIKGEFDKKETDHLLEIAKQQGYVKSKCRLPGQIVMALINDSQNPCDGCNHFDCKNN